MACELSNILAITHIYIYMSYGCLLEVRLDYVNENELIIDYQTNIYIKQLAKLTKQCFHSVVTKQ